MYAWSLRTTLEKDSLSSIIGTSSSSNGRYPEDLGVAGVASAILPMALPRIQKLQNWINLLLNSESLERQ